MQKRANILIILFIFIVTIASTSPVFAWDSLKEVRGVYGGNYKDTDVHDFCNYLYNNHGYTKYVYVYQNSSPDRLRYATWEDILYWSGHGWSTGQLTYGLTEGERVTEDHKFYGPEYVGINWVTQGKTTNSYWNNDLEWVIFAACNQMTEPARTKWAKTMLGTQHQVHGICGYDGTGPGDIVDNAIVDKFMAYLNAGYSFCFCWEMANETNGQRTITYWGTLAHSGNRYDTLSNYDDNSRNPIPGSTPDIRYYSNSNPTTGIPIQPSALTNSGSSQILLNEGNKKLILKANLPINYSKTLKPAKGVKKAISKDNLIAKVMSKEEKVDIKDYALGTIYKKDNKMIDFRKDGDILIVEKETINDVEVLSEEFALDIAKKYVEEKLGMPKDVKLGRVRYSCEEQVDLLDNSKVLEKDTKKVTAYIFEFTQDIDGVPMSLNAGGNKIQVKVDADGVVYGYINWDNIEFDSFEREKQIISCSQALDKVISYIKAAESIDYNKEMTITNVALVYSNSLCEDKTNYIPVWEIIFEDGRIIHVDAFDGNVIDLNCLH